MKKTLPGREKVDFMNITSGYFTSSYRKSPKRRSDKCYIHYRNCKCSTFWSVPFHANCSTALLPTGWPDPALCIDNRYTVLLWQQRVCRSEEVPLQIRQKSPFQAPTWSTGEQRTGQSSTRKYYVRDGNGGFSLVLYSQGRFQLPNLMSMN